LITLDVFGVGISLDTNVDLLFRLDEKQLIVEIGIDLNIEC
jgi:hypothetical protein